VAFATARVRGGDPADLGRLAGAVDTLVVLMPLDGLAETASALAETLGGARPAAVVAEAGTPRQRVVRATLETIAADCAEARIAAPATLVVGEVVTAVPMSLPTRARVRVGAR